MMLDVEDLLRQMTLQEKVAMLAGTKTWYTVPVERLGIPSLKMSDGPNGARGAGGLTGGVKTACFPAGISLASTDRKSTRLNSSHSQISYAVFCLKKKKKTALHSYVIYHMD